MQTLCVGAQGHERLNPLPRVSVIVPVHNGAAYLERCLSAVFATHYPLLECIVVDDASNDDSRAIATNFDVRLARLHGHPRGPAHARNTGAAAATGDILFFIDADVVIHADAIDRLVETFMTSDVDAVFGSYDDTPDAPDFVSQFKNLFHHFVHQQARNDGQTFWTGCGAVSRSAFADVGGFDDARYAQPSIEDIDLGYRLRNHGYRIALNKEVQAKHLKKWTLRQMVETDVFKRAIPWTLLIMRDRTLPNDLNVRVSSRASAVLLQLALLDLAVATVLHSVAFAIPPLLAALMLLVVAYWPAAPGASRPPNWRVEMGVCALLGAVVLIAVLTARFDVALLVVAAGAAVLIARRIPRFSSLRTRTGSALAVSALAAAMVLVLVDVPALLLVPLVASLGLVFALNFNVYAFFARKRGALFALSMLPFLLLYYCYSTFAFAAGTCMQLWIAWWRPRVLATGEAER